MLDDSSKPRTFAIWSLISMGLIGLTFLPLILSSSYYLALMCQFGIAVIACLSLHMLVSQGGMFHFGHAMYVGLGAYATAWLIQGWLSHIALPGLMPWLPLVLPVISGLMVACIGALVGWICTRQGGVIFGMTTFGMAELFWATSLAIPFLFGDEAGISFDRGVFSPSQVGEIKSWIDWRQSSFVACLICGYALLCAIILWRLRSTPFGLSLQGVRDNATRVTALGQRASHLRWKAFVIASFFAGLAGSLQALNLEVVSTENLSLQHSTLLLIFVILGGAHHFIGAFIGAFAWVFFVTFLSRYTQAWWLYAGLMFMWTLWREPRGLAAYWVRLRTFNFSRSHSTVHAVGWGVMHTVGFLACIVGLILWIEMAYHRQQVSALGSTFQWGFFWVDVAKAAHWSIPLTLILIGWILQKLPKRLKEAA